MSKDDVEKAVREAEQYAAEDKKRREEVDVKNSADQLVFQTEKALGELGDKISAGEKSDIEAKLNDLKEAAKGSNVEDIKAKQDALQKAFYAVSERVYQQAAQAQQAQGTQDAGSADTGSTGNGGDNVVDADYKEV